MKTMYGLNEKEQKLAQRLIEDGLNSASTTLSSLLKSPISITKIDFGNDAMDSVKESLEENKIGGYHILRTELIGELQGVCHLIFSAAEIEAINQISVPASLLESSAAEAKLLSEGFLTELDNIVSASVITELSNGLDMDIFGHVPSLHIMDATELQSYLVADASQFNNVVHFKANFKGEELNVCPEFTWMFQDQFLTRVKEVSLEVG
ncbi:hypothetical protein BFP72_05850 [Reichenbachiella sp. 5M10]|uniref:hypothetical protein n=1 Tax=Reichenbachiella sp. 5M10 TaxID=1889772 RepID=UPI000C15B7A3|nr:hypothetical protein [Reichenbachiella sp. 5M10]PIB34950.1 hypothetical protein BFP72_05850 [Reichenbachiella sp. 5M10]